jgi:hypothetical protein
MIICSLVLFPHPCLPALSPAVPFSAFLYHSDPKAVAFAALAMAFGALAIAGDARWRVLAEHATAQPECLLQISPPVMLNPA